MHTIVPPHIASSRKRIARGVVKQHHLRKPLYDCQDHVDRLELTVYVPGVEASGVEISSIGPDLIVTARKSHFVRVNFQALHLEGSQLDYRLVLRLGNHLDYANLHAEILSGVLTLKVPKKVPADESSFSSPFKRVA